MNSQYLDYLRLRSILRRCALHTFRCIPQRTQAPSFLISSLCCAEENHTSKMNSCFNDVTVARKCGHADKGKNIKIKTYSHIGTLTPRWFSWLLMWWFPSSAPVKLFDVLHSGTDKGKQEVLWVEKQPNQPGKLSENNSPRCLWHRDLQSLIQDGIPEPTRAHSTIFLQNHRTREQGTTGQLLEIYIFLCAVFRLVGKQSYYTIAKKISEWVNTFVQKSTMFKGRL